MRSDPGSAGALPDLPSDEELAAACTAIVGSLPSREQTIASARLLALGKARTLADLGEKWGLTRERVRQLEAATKEMLRGWADAPQYSAARSGVRVLENHLGSAFRTRELQVFSPRTFGSSPLASFDECPGLLLLWLAGPYRLSGDWLMREKRAGQLAQRTRDVIEELMVDDVADLDAVGAALGSLDIRESQRLPWLESQKGIRVLSGHVLRWGPSASDKAYAILRHNDAPMTAEELAAAIGNVRTENVKNQISVDSRIQRIGKVHFGLPEWGDSEYRSITDEILKELERQGGEASGAHLVRTIVEARGVSAASVVMYLESSMFVSTSRGTFRVATDEEIVSQAKPIDLTSGCYRLAECWSVRLTVTGDTFRGSGTRVPEAFVKHLGLLPRENRSFSTEFGPINVSWTAMAGSVGSLRRVAEALGADEGDFIFVKAVGDDRLEYELVRQSALCRGSRSTRLAASVAWGGLGEESEPRLAICHALGFSDPANAAVSSAIARIRERREAEFLPAFGQSADQRE